MLPGFSAGLHVTLCIIENMITKCYTAMTSEKTKLIKKQFNLLESLQDESFPYKSGNLAI